MDDVRRPITIAIIAFVLLAAGWLIVPKPHAPSISHTPAAPIQAIQPARDAAGASDASNAQLQQALDAAGQGATP